MVARFASSLRVANDTCAAARTEKTMMRIEYKLPKTNGVERELVEAIIHIA